MVNFYPFKEAFASYKSFAEKNKRNKRDQQFLRLLEQ